MTAPASKTFLITGVSTGLGRGFAKEALAAGHRVIGTLRSEEACRDFEKEAPGRAFGRLLDITDMDVIPRVVDDIEREVGAIDVLINNAGYGHEGIVEESPLDELRQQFEVNVFGTVAVTKAVLPHMRQRRRGHIITVTSMGGLYAFPGVGYYHGSKFALEGIFEALGKEVKGFGIHVTAVEPGGFRTDWAGRSMVRAQRKITDYDELFEPLRQARLARSGRQPGDPAKAGQAILKLIEADNPPTHLLLGADALQYVREKLASLRSEIDAWEALSRSTAFD